MPEEKTLKEQAIEYLKLNYTADEITEEVDEEIVNGNWADDWEEDDCEDEYDWYEQYGRGEAEDVVREMIDKEILKHLNVTPEEYLERAGENIYETSVEVYSALERTL